MLTFDGKFVYEGIDRVTNNFDDEHCIGKDGQGSGYKVEIPSGEIIASRNFIHYFQVRWHVSKIS